MRGRATLPDDLPKALRKSESGISLKLYRTEPSKVKEDLKAPRKSWQDVIYLLMLGHGKLLG